MLRHFLPRDEMPWCDSSWVAAGIKACATATVPNASIVRQTAAAGLIVLALATLLLVGRRLAQRSFGLGPAHRGFPALAATLFVLAAASLLWGLPLQPEDVYPIEEGSGARVAVIVIPVLLAAALVVAVGGAMRRAGVNRRHSGHPYVAEAPHPM